jgi:hypothetical protein
MIAPRNRGTPSFTDVKLLVWPNSTNEVLPVDIKCGTQFNALIKVGHCKCFSLNVHLYYCTFEDCSLYMSQKLPYIRIPAQINGQR